MKFVKTGVKLNRVDDIALSLTSIFQGGDIVVLVGDIGTGKTTLVAELAKMYETREPATSPTFAIVSRYDLRQEHNSIQSITHVDTYRLHHVNELYDLGFETIFSPTTLTLIEWGDRIEEYIDKNHFRLTIEEESDDKRSYLLEYVGMFDNKRARTAEKSLKGVWKKSD